jgi:hypothetical protein
MKALRMTFVLAAICSASPAMADDEIESARRTAGDLSLRLGTLLKKELAENGPVGAISVCRDAAPSLAGELSRKSGGRVSRVSLKTRNPLLGQPDAWEQQILLEFERRLASGEKPEGLEKAEQVEEPAGRYFRYMKALTVQPLCLTCHGTADTIPDAVKSKLAAEYPHDNATGYSPGQIRGAISIKRPAAVARQ